MIQINVYHVGETWYTCAHDKPYASTFHAVVNRIEQGHCSQEIGLPSRFTAYRLTDPWVPTQFLFSINHWSMGGGGGQSQTSIDVMLHWFTRLISPPCKHYVQYLLTGVNSSILTLRVKHTAETRPHEEWRHANCASLSLRLALQSHPACAPRRISD
jgi:hypothetical protein